MLEIDAKNPETNKFDQYVDKVCAPPQGDSSGSIGMQETCHEV